MAYTIKPYVPGLPTIGSFIFAFYHLQKRKKPPKWSPVEVESAVGVGKCGIFFAHAVGKKNVGF